MNTVLLFGKVKKVHTINDNWVALELLVKRDFRNQNGDFEYDVFTINFYCGIGQYISQLELENKNISVSGRLEVKGAILNIIGHKITMLE